MHSICSPADGTLVLMMVIKDEESPTTGIRDREIDAWPSLIFDIFGVLTRVF